MRPASATSRSSSGVFESWLEGRPEATCLIDGERSWSRQAFSQAVNDEVAALVAHGVCNGAIVAWLGHNTLRMLATLLACERIGSVFLPLNWRLRVAELASIVNHAGAGHLLGTPEVDDLRSALEPHVTLRPGRAEGVEAGDCLLVYTSGTTGNPKGALHTAAGMQANVRAAIAAQDLDAHSRTLAVLPMFHVGGLCIQTLPTLAAGGVVILNARFSPDDWFDSLRDSRPTTSLLVPAVMRALIEHPRWSQADLSGLSFVCAGSQVVPDALIAAFHQRGVPVAQIYGATETGPVSIYLRAEDAMRKAGSAGQAGLHVEVKLTDGQGAPVPRGTVGEIRIRGLNVMQGYWNDADNPAFQDGWFATGDLAYQDEEGFYHVVGRSKDMIISGGENIYPAEIENILADCPLIAECAFVGMPDERWGEVAVAVVVLAPGADMTQADVLALFDGKLARFKHPRRVVFEAALPRSALGKVLKQELKNIMKFL